MSILYEEIQFINSRKVNSPSIPQFPFTTSMSHDHNYKVQEDLTISTWGNSCLLLGNIARILQINHSCFALCIVMSSHFSHRFVIFVLFFLYFGSTGIPSDIKLCLTGRSTTWNDFSSRTTITSAENPDFEIWLELNSPHEFSSAYSANNRADSLHHRLLSYRQNRNDAKIYSGVQVAILTLLRKFKRGKHPCTYYSN